MPTLPSCTPTGNGGDSLQDGEVVVAAAAVDNTGSGKCLQGRDTVSLVRSADGMHLNLFGVGALPQDSPPRACGRASRSICTRALGLDVESAVLAQRLQAEEVEHFAGKPSKHVIHTADSHHVDFGQRHGTKALPLANPRQAKANEVVRITGILPGRSLSAIAAPG